MESTSQQRIERRIHAEHQRVAALLAREPERVLAHARANFERWGWRRLTDSAWYAREWRRLLWGPLEPLREVLTAPLENEYAVRARSSSPFAGLLRRETSGAEARKAEREGEGHGMKRDDVAHVLRAAAGITGVKQFLVFGVKALARSLDDDALSGLGPLWQGSVEADIFPLDRPDLLELLDDSLGEGSAFHAAFGYYADAVEPETATLPEGWQSRLVPFDAGEGVSGLCLEPHDLCAAKLEAGRSKDKEFLLDCLRAGLVRLDTLRARISLLPVSPERRALLDERARLMANTAGAR